MQNYYNLLLKDAVIIYVADFNFANGKLQNFDFTFKMYKSAKMQC